jgi:hypothetical protein
MTLQEQIIAKQKELIELYRKYSIITMRPDSTAIEWIEATHIKENIDKIESELAALTEKQELIKTTINPSNLYPEPTAIEAKEQEVIEFKDGTIGYKGKVYEPSKTAIYGHINNVPELKYIPIKPEPKEEGDYCGKCANYEYDDICNKCDDSFCMFKPEPKEVKSHWKTKPVTCNFCKYYNGNCQLNPTKVYTQGIHSCSLFEPKEVKSAEEWFNENAHDFVNDGYSVRRVMDRETFLEYASQFKNK